MGDVEGADAGRTHASLYSARNQRCNPYLMTLVLSECVDSVWIAYLAP